MSDDLISRAAAIEVAMRHRSKIEVNEPLWHEGQDWAADRISEAIRAIPAAQVQAALAGMTRERDAAMAGAVKVRDGYRVDAFDLQMGGKSVPLQRAIQPDPDRLPMAAAALKWLYEIANQFRDECYIGKPEGCNEEVVGFFRPYYDAKMGVIQAAIDDLANLRAIAARETRDAQMRAEGRVAGLREAAEIARDHTPEKHSGATLASHVTGRAIEDAILARAAEIEKGSTE